MAGAGRTLSEQDKTVNLWVSGGPSPALVAQVFGRLIAARAGVRMKRAALYLRSSKDRNDVSPDAQRRALMEIGK